MGDGAGDGGGRGGDCVAPLLAVIDFLLLSRRGWSAVIDFLLLSRGGCGLLAVISGGGGVVESSRPLSVRLVRVTGRLRRVAHLYRLSIQVAESDVSLIFGLTSGGAVYALYQVVN